MTKFYAVHIHGDEEEQDPVYAATREEAIEWANTQVLDEYAYVLQVTLALRDDEKPASPQFVCRILNHDSQVVQSAHFVYENVPGSHAYYWSHEYRHYLRDAVPSRRVAVLAAFKAAGLDPEGCSPEHERIVVSITAPEELAKSD